MPEGLNLVSQLAIILISAAVFTVICKALKQPLILGYIIAGFLVGPNLGLFPQFDAESVHQWSELGIIFLLFGLGLEFSTKKLMKIGQSALITSVVKCIGMFAVGIVTGKAIGWSQMESIFLGGMLGMSSTTIIIKAYEDLKLKDRPYSPLIFGSLVFEDLIAVLLLVLLSTLATSGQGAGFEVALSILKLIFCIVLWFVVGIFLIPLLLKWAKKYLDDEILLLAGIGLCFLMVVIANLCGFSSALGAFVMGSILAETLEGERIEHVTKHVKDLFGAIFFVSVGMMVAPEVIVEHWGPILAITVVSMGGILLFSTIGVIIAGKGLDTAVHAGFSLAQLGEFAFIIAGLGCSLGVLRGFIYPVIIAVSVITTFTTPYMIKAGDSVSLWMHNKLEGKNLPWVNPREDHHDSSLAEKNEWSRLLKAYCTRICIFSILLIAIKMGCDKLLPLVRETVFPQMGSMLWEWIATIVTLLLMSPCIIAVAVSGDTVRGCADRILSGNRNARWPIMSLVYLRSAIATTFIVAALTSHLTFHWWVLLLLILGTLAAFIGIASASSKRFELLSGTFMENYNEKEIAQRRLSPVTSAVKETLGDYDVSLKAITVSPDFDMPGKTLREMPFRKVSGANILKIKRGTRSILIPSGDETIYPDDVLLAVGTDTQLEKFSDIMEEHSVSSQIPDPEFSVQKFSLTESSPLVGRSLRDTSMRASGCMVVCVIPFDSNKLITNPSPEHIFHVGDTVWIAGEKTSVEWYLN